MSIFDKSIQIWCQDTQQYLEHMESSEEASRKDMITIQKLGNGAVRLSDLEENEFTEPINVDKLKMYFA